MAKIVCVCGHKDWLAGSESDKIKKNVTKFTVGKLKENSNE